MPLEKQVCSLELAKRLKELGVKQESLYFWNCNTSFPTLWNEDSLNQKEWIEPLEVYSAFTVAELGEKFPGNDGTCRFVTQKGLMGNLWYCSRERMDSNRSEHTEEADTEAEARAKMLIYLIESSLIKEPTN